MNIDNPIKFFEFITGFKPYKYQAKFLKSKSKRITVRSGRQVGKTTMCAVKALHEAFWHSDRQILLVAPVQRQSKYLFQMIKDFVRKNEDIRKAVARETATEMFFDYGSRIYCLTGAILSKDKTRGYSPNLLIIDEAAFVPDETFYSLEPSVIRTQGIIILCSTPFGKRGFFYESFQDEEYEKFHIRCQDCPHIPKKELKKKKLKVPKVRYLQEYEGEFTAESDVYFNPDLIDSCIFNIEQIDAREPGRKYWLGVDCARMGQDETVYLVRDDNGDVKKIIAESKQPSTNITAKIKYLHEIFGFEKINIDDAGTGGAVYDFLFAEQYPVYPHKFSIKGRAEIYGNLKNLMENKKIRIPKNDKLISQLKDLRQSFTIQGIKIQPPLGRHDDYADALALAFKDMKVLTEEKKKEDWFIY